MGGAVFAPRPKGDTHMSEMQGALDTLTAVFQAIAAAGPEGVPSGHLYAASVNRFGGLASYEACLGVLIRARLVRRDGHILRVTAA